MSHKKNLSNCTFIVPVRIDSDDRTRNLITVLCFLLGQFDTKIILKEVASEPFVEDYILPQVKDFLDDKLTGLTYLFEKSDDFEFHRMKIINEMLNQVDTDVVVNYDSDVLLRPEVYEKSVSLILDEKYDIIYPYGFGDYQKQIYADDKLVSDFLNNDFDFSILESKEKIYMSQFGHVQFLKTKSYIDAGMENENFISWSPEDKERYFRFDKLGYKVGRIDDAFVYHLEHYRGQNSWFNNPHIARNNQLWEHLQTLTTEQLQEYYQSQDYLNKYKCRNNYGQK
jgi:hypothetical protein